jgi:carbamate kinase
MNSAIKICLIYLNTIVDLVLTKYNKIKEKPIEQLGINKLTGLILKISKMTSIAGSMIPKKSK